MAKVELKPINRRTMTFGIRGTSPLIMHKWSEKSKAMMRDKHAGRKTKTREVRDPENEARDATYTTDSGDIGIPGMGFKLSVLAAAHKDLGIERTLVSKSVFLVTDDTGDVLPIAFGSTRIREDYVRVGQTTDLRYRPEFTDWSAKIELHIDGELLQPKDVLTLVDRAGFGIGICEWRPEKRGGRFGRFEIDPNVPVTFE